MKYAAVNISITPNDNIIVFCFAQNHTKSKWYNNLFRKYDFKEIHFYTDLLRLVSKLYNFNLQLI